MNEFSYRQYRSAETGVFMIFSDIDATLSFELPGNGEQQLWEMRHFKSLIEAILFAVEEMPRERCWGSWIRSGDQTLYWAQIKAEYHRRTDGA
jgi:hypothetical protein